MFKKIPDRQPEELNLMYMLNRINSLENKLSNIDNVILNCDDFKLVSKKILGIITLNLRMLILKFQI